MPETGDDSLLPNPHAHAEAFADQFAAVWDAPTPEAFLPLFTPQVRLIAPLLPVTNGKDQAEEAFAFLLRLLPDLTATVQHWAPTPDGVMIDHVFSATLGSRSVAWHGIDRFVLDADGLALERVHYADSTALVRAAVRTPSVWGRLVLADAWPGRPLAPSHHDPVEPSGGAPATSAAFTPSSTATVLRRAHRDTTTYIELAVSLPARRHPIALRAVRVDHGDDPGPRFHFDALTTRARLWRAATFGRRLPPAADAPATAHAAP